MKQHDMYRKYPHTPHLAPPHLATFKPTLSHIVTNLNISAMCSSCYNYKPLLPVESLHFPPQDAARANASQLSRRQAYDVSNYIPTHCARRRGLGLGKWPNSLIQIKPLLSNADFRWRTTCRARQQRLKC